MANEATQVDSPQPSSDSSSTDESSLSVKAVDTMHVKVYSPFHVYFDGQANSVTADNDTGTFDILARHKNFLTLLRACNVVVRSGDKEEVIPITTGIMHVKADEVVVFLDV